MQVLSHSWEHLQALDCRWLVLLIAGAVQLRCTKVATVLE